MLLRSNLKGRRKGGKNNNRPVRDCCSVSALVEAHEHRAAMGEENVMLRRIAGEGILSPAQHA